MVCLGNEQRSFCCFWDCIQILHFGLFCWPWWLLNIDRVITLLTKVHIVKAMVLPGVMYRCESWTIKKAEHQRIDVFKLWCWRRLLRVPWSAGRSNQSILNEISPEYSLEGLMLKLKLQYWPTDLKSQLTGKDPDAGKDWGQEEKGMRWLDDIINSMDMNLSKFQEIAKDRETWHAVVHGVTESDRTDWTELNWLTKLLNPDACAICQGWILNYALLYLY